MDMNSSNISPSDQPSSLWSNIFDNHVQDKDVDLIGMMQQMNEIEKFVTLKFEQQKSSSSKKQSRGVLLIKGQAGCGKTVLIHKLRYKNREKYSISLLNIVNLISLRNINKEIKLDKLLCEYFLKINKQNNVLVLDEFEQLYQPYFNLYLQAIIDFINNLSSIPIILITNAQQKLPKQQWPTINQVIKIKNLDQCQRQQLLKDNFSKIEMIPKNLDCKLIAQLIGQRTTAEIITIVRDVSMLGLRRYLTGKKQLPKQITEEIKKQIQVKEDEILQYFKNINIKNKV